MAPHAPSLSLGRSALAVIAALLAFALLLAPSVTSDAHAAARPALTGTLVSPEGSARAGFKVELRDEKGVVLTSTRSAKDGTFTLQQPVAGTKFHLVARAPSGATNVPDVWIGSRGAQAWDERTATVPYQARQGRAIATGTHTLLPGAGFDVTFAGAAASADAQVQVMRLDGETVWEGAASDPSLRVGFLPGRYQVAASTADRAAAPVELAVPAGRVAPVTLTLAAKPAPPTISGIVTIDGKPSTDRWVEAVRTRTSWDDRYDGDRSVKTRTDAAGRFTMVAPGPGTWEVKARTAFEVRGGSRTVVVGTTDVTANLPIERTALGKVSGRLTVAGKEARGKVTLVRGREVRYTATLSNGRYVFRDVVPSTYHLTYLDKDAKRYYTTRITVKASQHRALKPKKVTRKTVTVAGKYVNVSRPPVMTSPQQGDIKLTLLKGSRYRAAHVIPATLRIEVAARDDSIDEWEPEAVYTPRISSVKITKSRTLHLKDGGVGGTVTARLRFAESGRPVYVWSRFLACKGVACLRADYGQEQPTANPKTATDRPRVTGLESTPYKMTLRQTQAGEEVDDFHLVEEYVPAKNPYYLERISIKVRAVKGKTVDLGTIDVHVRGTL